MLVCFLFASLIIILSHRFHRYHRFLLRCAQHLFASLILISHRKHGKHRNFIRFAHFLYFTSKSTKNSNDLFASLTFRSHRSHRLHRFWLADARFSYFTQKARKAQKQGLRPWSASRVAFIWYYQPNTATSSSAVALYCLVCR